MATGGLIQQQKGAGDLMDFYIGQKVIIDCDDTRYLEDCAVDNGMVGEVININHDKHYPVKVKVNSHIAPIECCFRFDELKAARGSAKII
jgi:ATP-dependent exoDNAse (exonuclease V) alpha subunit